MKNEFAEDDEWAEVEIPYGEDLVNADFFPPDFDTNDLPDGWTMWTWDDLWAWIDEYYDVPDGDGGYGSGGLNAG